MVEENGESNFTVLFFFNRIYMKLKIVLVYGLSQGVCLYVATGWLKEMDKLLLHNKLYG